MLEHAASKQSASNPSAPRLNAVSELPLPPDTLVAGLQVPAPDPRAVIEVASAGSSTTNDPSGTDKGKTGP